MRGLTMDNITGIHHIALVTNDFNRSMEFYKKLGLTPYIGWGEGSKRIQLMTIGNGAYLEIFANGDGDTTEPKRFIHLALQVKDVDAAYQTALAAGAQPKIAPKVVELDSDPVKGTLNCAFVFGPDGEVIEFFRQLA
jgi:catechol 2,3-dioxygenase-like lactoylglutathione lyase family enzyme